MIATAAALMSGAAVATAAELPTYQANSFPITPHQIAIMGAVDVEQLPVTATLMHGDMPASPHQVAVLTPRTITVGQQAAAQPITVGASVQ